MAVTSARTRYVCTSRLTPSQPQATHEATLDVCTRSNPRGVAGVAPTKTNTSHPSERSHTHAGPNMRIRTAG